MNKWFVMLLSLFLVVAFYPAVSQAAAPCPEVETAKDMLKKRQVAMTERVEAPRALAGAKQERIEAPRTQERVEAPRAAQQRIEAPRAQA
ncbi:MAG: hypothetical protein HY724_06595, partial [Candidatus Rokubacteria bacterium]|nr:hypothetical protein [Candidatus Rokubacteria bacterium]